MLLEAMSFDSDSLYDAVSQVLSANQELIQGWLRDEPGSWGALAGKTVLAYRQLMQRKLTDLERKKVWILLWQHLVSLRTSHC